MPGGEDVRGVVGCDEFAGAVFENWPIGTVRVGELLDKVAPVEGDDCGTEV